MDPAKRWNYLEECQAAVARGCDEAKDVAAGLTEVLAGTSDLFVTTYACPFDGRYHWYQVLISPIYRGELRKAMTMHVDVSALQRDPLTKLPNRALLDAQLGFAINAAKNNNTRLGVLLVDMNNLKLINDQFGHAVGDCAMTSMARCLNKVFEPHGMVTRIGGDEFGIVLGDTADDVSVRRLQNEFAACLNKQDCESAAPRMSASFGFSVLPEDGVSREALLKAADERMYASKHQRRIA